MEEDGNSGKAMKLVGGSVKAQHVVSLLEEAFGGNLSVSIIHLAEQAPDFWSSAAKLLKLAKTESTPADIRDAVSTLLHKCQEVFETLSQDRTQFEKLYYGSRDEVISAQSNLINTQSQVIQQQNEVLSLTKALSDAEAERKNVVKTTHLLLKELQATETAFTARLIVETALRIFFQRHLALEYKHPACLAFLAGLVQKKDIAQHVTSSAYFVRNPHWSKVAVLEHFLQCQGGLFLVTECTDPTKVIQIKMALHNIQAENCPHFWNSLHKAHHAIDIGEEAFIIRKGDRTDSQTLILASLLKFCSWDFTLMEGDNSGTIIDDLKTKLQQSLSSSDASSTADLSLPHALPIEPNATDPTALTVLANSEGQLFQRRFPAYALSEDLTRFIVSISPDKRKHGRRVDVFLDQVQLSARIMLTPGLPLTSLIPDFSKELILIWK